MQKIAIVTGITGMDGGIISRQLLDLDYKIFGLVRRSSDSPNLKCAEGLQKEPNFEVVEGDLTDLSSLLRLVRLAKPHEIYNFASQSNVGTSFKEPIHTAQVTGIGVLNMLEAIRLSEIHSKFYQASTSELMGGISEKPCNEDFIFHPKSPYAVSKLFGYWITRCYRESYRMFTVNGVLFNHEYFSRGPNFVTRKISLGVANIKVGNQDKLYLGNLDSRRDWGWAPDFVRGARMMLQYKEPQDWVLATGETHSIREFCELAFKHAGLGDYQNFVQIDPQFYRPNEVNVLIGDYSKAKRILGWEPTVKFEELVKRMVDYDIKQIALDEILHR